MLFNLDKLLQIVYGNQSKAARFLGLNRGTLRTDINDNTDIVVLNGKVYKEVGRADFRQLSETERLRLKEQLARDGADYCPHCWAEIKHSDTTCCVCGEAVCHAS